MEPPETVSSSDLPLVVSSVTTNMTPIDNNYSSNNHERPTDYVRNNDNPSSNHGPIDPPADVNTNQHFLTRNIARENVSLKQRVQQLETENMKYQQQLLDREDELSDLKIDVETQKKKADIMKLELNEKRANNIRLQSEIHNYKINADNTTFQYEELKSTFANEKYEFMLLKNDLQAEVTRSREELKEVKARLAVVDEAKATASNYMLKNNDLEIEVSKLREELEKTKAINEVKATVSPSVVNILSLPEGGKAPERQILPENSRLSSIDTSNDPCELCSTKVSNTSGASSNEAGRKASEEKPLARREGDDNLAHQGKRQSLYVANISFDEATSLASTKLTLKSSCSTSVDAWKSAQIKTNRRILELCEKFSVPIMRMQRRGFKDFTLSCFIYLPKSLNNIEIVNTLTATKNTMLKKMFEGLKCPSNPLKLIVSTERLEIVANYNSLTTFICHFFCGLVSELTEELYGREDVLASLVKRRLEAFQCGIKMQNTMSFYYSCVLPLQIANAELVRGILLGEGCKTINAIQKTVNDSGVSVAICNQSVIITHKSSPERIGVVAAALRPLLKEMAFNSSYYLGKSIPGIFPEYILQISL